MKLGGRFVEDFGHRGNQGATVAGPLVVEGIVHGNRVNWQPPLAGRWQSGRMRAPAKRLSGLLIRSPGSNPGLPATHTRRNQPPALNLRMAPASRPAGRPVP